MKTAGIILLVIGLGLTIFTTVQFFTKKKVVDLGAIEISKNEPHSLSWSPLIGIAVMGVGGLMMWKGTKK